MEERACSNMDKYSIPNLARACQILKLFSRTGGTLNSSEVARRMQMPRTTVLRILHTFCDEGLLVRENKNFRAGSELLRLGLGAMGPAHLRSVAVPTLRGLALSTGETSHLALLSGDKALIVEVCDSPHPVHATSRAGTLADLHASATGKVLLSFGLSTSAEAFVGTLDLRSRTPSTITSTDALLAEVERVCRQGYALDNEEYHVGVRCLAAPVWDAHGNLAAAMGITASVASFPKRKVAEMAGHVMSAAMDLSHRLGYRAAKAAIGINS
ncbi:MAG: IclR family transcriptional regulator [Deltaproteobacteria bacterium]|nr:IclR family transcriptional regulator [Deltaproteobacteria bacterium]